MRRILIPMLVAGALVVGTAPAGLAQEAQDEEQERPPEDSVVVEPVPPYEEGPLVLIAVEVRAGGEAVDALRAGTDGRVIFRFRNEGDTDLRGAVLRLTEVWEGVTVGDSEARLGDVEAGGEAEAGFDVRIDASVCQDFIGLAGEIAWDGGSGPFKAGFPATCPGPRLWAEDARYEGGDGDDVPEPGERLRVTVVLRNDGADLATDVVGTLRIDHPDVRVIEGEARWPEIATQSSEASISTFVIEISADAERAEPCQPFARGEPVSSDDGGGASGSGGAVKIAPAPGAEPVEEEPVEGPPPDEPVEEPGGEPEQDMPVPFEGQIEVRASGTTQTAYIGTMIACALYDAARGEPEPAPAEEVAAADDAGAKAGRGSAAPIAGVLVAAAVVLLIAKLRLSA